MHQTHSTDGERYALASVIVHWLTLVLMVVLVVSGQIGHEMPRGPDKLFVMNMHKSFGLFIVLLTVLRLVIYRLYPRPRLQGTPLERVLARVTHLALYGILFLMPVTGVLSSMHTGLPIKVFNLFNIPSPLAADRQLHELWSGVHEFLFATFLGLLALHVAAAVRHTWISRTDTARQMMFVTRETNEGRGGKP